MSEENAQPTPEQVNTETTIDTATTDAAAPVEAPVETADSIWDKEIVISEEKSETPPEPKADEVTPSVPAEGESAAASEEKPAEDAAEVTEEIKDYPLKMNRVELRKFDQAFTSKFRDPDTPVGEAFAALHAFLPTRAEALAQEILDTSAAQNPDKWLQVILGDETATVKSVQERLQGVNNEPRPETIVAPSNGHTPAINKVIEVLTGDYGEKWRDPANDAEINSYDLDNVKAFREQLSLIEGEQSKTDGLQKKLDELEPQIADIKTAQQTEVANKINEAHQGMVNQYREKIETASLTKVLTDKALTVSENDTPEVKAVKELVQSQFKPYHDMASNFDVFVIKAFSDRDNFGKIINRTDRNLKDAAEKTIKAQRTKDPNEAQRLNNEAQALRLEADREQDALQVLYHKAASEFLSTTQKPVMDLLALNADLNRRLALNGDRVEIVDGGGTALATGDGWKEQIDSAAKAGKDPFDVDLADIVQKRATAGA